MAIGIGREADEDLPTIGRFQIAAADFADDRVLPAFSHTAAQKSLDLANGSYRRNFQEANPKKTVVLIYDPTVVVRYQDATSDIHAAICKEILSSL